MLSDNDKCLEFIQKMSVQQSQVIKVWRKYNKIKDPSGKIQIQNFLIKYYPDIDFPFFTQDKEAKKALEDFLLQIDDQKKKEKLTTQVYNFHIQKLRDELVKTKKIQLKPKNVLGNNALLNKMAPQQLKRDQIKETIIDGKQLEVRIVLNSKRMDPEYTYLQFNLKDYLVKFVKVEIVQTIIKVASQKQIKNVRILNFKQQFKDNYTGSYVFDPFFNSVKITISKKDNSSFNGSFKVKNPNDIKIKFEDDIQDANWIDQSDFQLSDSVNTLIDYLCQKENADLQTRQALKQNMRQHGYVTIKDLMYNTKESLYRVIVKKKWANQLESEIQKIRGATRKSFTGNQNMTSEKKQCRRTGNSHKILRFLFFKIESRKNALDMEDEFLQNTRRQISLKQLNKRIPKINPQLMKKVIKIIKQQLMIEDLFPQLQRYFQYFTEIPDASKAAKFEHPYGVLFYGPPGTGKTRLTEDLAELMGFHLASHGLSSAQFMKQFVGQAKGTVHSFLRRAEVSKHLICSLAIDEIDAIVGDRRKQNSKGSQQTVAMFLSALGGNQAIENILVFGSTNFRNLIDDAILRRLTPDFYVRLPSKQDRKKIIKILLPSLEKDEDTLQFIASITPNYSGAAMKLLCQKTTLYKQKNLSKSQLIKIASEVGVSYKIKFGDETFPQLYQRIQKTISLDFIKNTKNRTIFIQKLTNSQARLFYFQEQKCWKNNQLQNFTQLKHSDFKLDSNKINYQEIVSWVGSLTSSQQEKNHPQIIKCKNELGSEIKSSRYKNKESIFVVNLKKNLEKISIHNKNQEFTNIIYYVQGITQQKIQQNFKPHVYNSKNRTGRVIVDISSSSRPSMVFQLKKNGEYPNKICKKDFIQSRSVQLSKDTLPQIVEFLMSKQVQYIQMINSQLLHDNNAFDQNDIQTVVTSKIEEAKQYTKSSIIVDLSSLIYVSKSISSASTGDSTSRNINQPTLYHKLVELIKNFAYIQAKKQQQRWIFVIVQDGDLLEMLKKDIKWPLSPEEQKQQYDIQKNQQRQKLKKQPRICISCTQLYTHEQNEKQKSCKQHYGFFVDMQQCRLIDDDTVTLQEIRFRQTQMNIGITEDRRKHKFHYTCCWKDINSQGCRDFQHWSGAQLQEQIQHVTQLRQRTYQMGLWQNQCRRLRQSVYNVLRQ